MQKLLFSEDDKINRAKWRSYFSFFQSEKAENGTALTETFENHFDRGNTELFKDFSMQKKWNGEALTEANENYYERNKRTSQLVRFILSSSLSIFLMCGMSMAGWAQELNCKLTVLHDKITGVDAQVFTNMQKALNEFVNGHKWSKDDFAPSEKIDCSILINLTANNVGGVLEVYTATLSIQATRPVYNSGYTTNLINFVDKDITFNYSPFSILNFDDNAVSGTDPLSSNLTAVIAYYAYLTLALDYDSFAPEGGTQFLKKAQNIVSNAPDGKGITGWKSVENTHNRYWIVDELLNPRFSDIRSCWYTMHREGLDSMSMKPAESRTRILNNIKKISNVNKDNPSSILVQFFFNAKGDEMVHLLGQAPKAERGQYITLLTALDVPNAEKYNSLR